MLGSVWDKVVPLLVLLLPVKLCDGCYFVYAAHLVSCGGEREKEKREREGEEEREIPWLLSYHLSEEAPARIQSEIHLPIRQAEGWLEEYKCLLSFSMAEALFPASSPSGPVTSDMVITHIMYPGTW